MRNNYEMADVLELGSSEHEILGSKPLAFQFDVLLGFPRRTQPLPDDIDENDE